MILKSVVNMTRGYLLLSYLIVGLSVVGCGTEETTNNFREKREFRGYPGRVWKNDKHSFGVSLQDTSSTGSVAGHFDEYGNITGIFPSEVQKGSLLEQLINPDSLRSAYETISSK